MRVESTFLLRLSSGRVSFFTREVLTELHGNSAINHGSSLASGHDGNLRFEEITAGAPSTFERRYRAFFVRRRTLFWACTRSSAWQSTFDPSIVSARCVGSREGPFLQASLYDCWRRPVSLLLSTSPYLT